MQRNRTWRSVVVWSIISAAFIGPGTVTTAATAGSLYQLELLWVVVAATLVCILLQEVAARIAISSGKNIGQSLTQKFGHRNGKIYRWIIGATVIGGCAAYEAGNILGAVSGLQPLLGLESFWLIAGVCSAAALMLWFGNPRWIFTLMMILVAVMGFAFIWVAIMREFPLTDILEASFVPVMPAGAQLLLLGLLGTTIVPYNLFLASGVSTGQTIPLMRVGLVISVLVGGAITGAILVVGAGMKDFSSFAVLFSNVEGSLGKAASLTVALGLFAAGFSSTITAPYATSMIARTLFGIQQESNLRWWRMAVLTVGFFVSIMGLQPIQVILVVQALNGFILPLLVALLILLVNDHQIVSAAFMHGRFYNLILLLVFAAVLVVSLTTVDKALAGSARINALAHVIFVYGISGVITFFVAGFVFKMRRR